MFHVTKKQGGGDLFKRGYGIRIARGKGLK